MSKKKAKPANGKVSSRMFKKYLNDLYGKLDMLKKEMAIINGRIDEAERKLRELEGIELLS